MTAARVRALAHVEGDVFKLKLLGIEIIRDVEEFFQLLAGTSRVIHVTVIDTII